MMSILFHIPDGIGLEKTIERMEKSHFYNKLYHLLSERIDRGFKICVSILGTPYISMLSWFGHLSESVYRTMSCQPTLLYVLNHDNVCETKDYLEIGRTFAVFLEYMVKKEEIKQRENVRLNIVHNLCLLHSQYNDKEHAKEVSCIKRICMNIMTQQELHLLLSGELI